MEKSETVLSPPLPFSFLALLDLVSTDHEIAIWWLCPSVVRTWTEFFRTFCAYLFSNFSCDCPGPYAWIVFEFLNKTKRIFQFCAFYFSFSLTCPPTVAKISKCYPSFERFSLLQTFPEFASQWSSRNYCFKFFIVSDF